MNFTDPFKVDTSRYKDLLNEDSEPDTVEVEEVTDPSSLLDHGTIKGLPPPAFKAVQEAKNKLSQNKEQKEAMSKMFNSLFKDLNDKYGLNVTIDFDSFSNSLSYIIEPTHKRALEYYLSEAYGRFRIVLYGQYLQAIAMLSAQILDPNYLLSESMDYNSKLDTMQKLYEFMSTMNDIYDKVNISDTEMKLEKLSSDTKPEYDLNDPRIRDFMESVMEENIK